MTNQELRELDAFCAEIVMGWRSCRSGMQSRSDPTEDAWLLPSKRYSTRFKNSWNPSTDSEDAMDVLKKCAEKKPVWLGMLEGKWAVSLTDSNEPTRMTQAETLELAICLFAKQLFSQTTK